MAGFQLPITVYTPQQLDQLARAAFKVPALNFGGGAGGGGMGGGGAAAPGFDAQAAAGAAQGLGKLGADLFNRGDPTSVTPTAGTSLGGGEGGGLTTMGSNGLYSVTGAGGDFSGGSMSFGGPRADGGPVMPSQSYTVGERGPETFVPAAPGYIVPNEERDFFGGPKQPESASGGGLLAAAGEPQSYAEWRSAVDAMRRGSGLPLLPHNQMYEKWLKLQGGAGGRT